MAVGTTTKVQNGFKIRGIEPLSVRNAPPSERLIYWGFVAEFLMQRKDRELARGLDKDGKPLKPISERTRKHRRSAMTPSGRGSPTAPPLTPAYQKSRTRSLFTARAYSTHVVGFWKFDPWTGRSWGDILDYQAKEGRDVFGLSPDGIVWVKVRADEKWAAHRRGEQPAPPKAQAVAPMIRGGNYDLSKVTLGIGTPEDLASRGKEGWSGFRTYEQWQAYWRQAATATLPGRPSRVKSPHPQVGPNYNRLLAQIWGVTPKAPRARGIAVKPPKPGPIVPTIAKPAPVAPPRSFVELVQAATEAVPEERLYTKAEHGLAGKAWVHHVWEEYQKIPGTPPLTLEQFKEALAIDPETRAIMSRADLVQAMNPADVAASLVRYVLGNFEAATWNFIRRKR